MAAPPLRLYVNSFPGLASVYVKRGFNAMKKHYNRKKQNFYGLVAVHSDKVFYHDLPRSGVRVVARVGVDQPYLTHFNQKTKKQSYFASLDSLPRNLKNAIVDEFSDFHGKKKHRVLYLVDK